jgi:hypothetical protein
MKPSRSNTVLCVHASILAAIGLYRSLIEDFPDRRDIAALALVELGQAYETLGQAQAQDAYNRVLRDYVDQREAAQRARARLAVLVGDDARRNTDEHGLRTRRLWSADVGLNPGGLSPDGREVLFVDWGGAPPPSRPCGCCHIRHPKRTLAPRH